jgi:hypothetical protein
MLSPYVRYIVGNARPTWGRGFQPSLYRSIQTGSFSYDWAKDIYDQIQLNAPMVYEPPVIIDTYYVHQFSKQYLDYLLWNMTTIKKHINKRQFIPIEEVLPSTSSTTVLMYKLLEKSITKNTYSPSWMYYIPITNTLSYQTINLFKNTPPFNNTSLLYTIYSYQKIGTGHTYSVYSKSPYIQVTASLQYYGSTSRETISVSYDKPYIKKKNGLYYFGRISIIASNIITFNGQPIQIVKDKNALLITKDNIQYLTDTGTLSTEPSTPTQSKTSTQSPTTQIAWDQIPYNIAFIIVQGSTTATVFVHSPSSQYGIVYTYSPNTFNNQILTLSKWHGQNDTYIGHFAIPKKHKGLTIMVYIGEQTRQITLKQEALNEVKFKQEDKQDNNDKKQHEAGKIYAKVVGKQDSGGNYINQISIETNAHTYFLYVDGTLWNSLVITKPGTHYIIFYAIDENGKLKIFINRYITIVKQ